VPFFARPWRELCSEPSLRSSFLSSSPIPAHFPPALLDSPPGGRQRMSSTRSSVELAARLGEEPDSSSPGRGADLQLVLMHEWLDRNKKRGPGPQQGPLTAAEGRIRGAIWEWYAGLSPGALERVSTCRMRGGLAAPGAGGRPAGRSSHEGRPVRGAAWRRALTSPRAAETGARFRNVFPRPEPTAASWGAYLPQAEPLSDACGRRTLRDSAG
jgi:hypothetical protein